MTQRVAVLGANGFVGSHVSAALLQRGARVVPVRAPRVGLTGAGRPETLRQLAEQLHGCDAIVNTAGIADATQSSMDLSQANHHLPDLLGEAAATLATRLVHVSSAAVQGRRRVLDSSREYGAFSPYSTSKAQGEHALLRRRMGSLCIYRPPGVHGRDRATTRTLVRLASTRAASVARPGSQNTPQALVQNVADAVAFLATIDSDPPTIVHHPSEGITTVGLLSALGGRPPRVIPRCIASLGVQALFVGSHARPGLQGHARRLEVLWLGQEQAPSWLEESGWRPPQPPVAWYLLGRQVRRDLRQEA